MFAKEYINNDIPFLKLTDDCNLALDIMDNFLVNELAVVENGTFIGIITNKEIYDFDLFDLKINEIRKKLLKTSVLENQHIFDVIKILNLYKYSLIPVVDNNDVYLGSITNQSIVENFAKLISIKEEGTYLRLDVEQKNFSATEIANIIEKNDAKLLGLFIDKIDENSKLVVYIKIYTLELSSILQSFDKFNYEVTLLSNKQSEYSELYNERLENFLKFLNI